MMRTRLIPVLAYSLALAAPAAAGTFKNFGRPGGFPETTVTEQESLFQVYEGAQFGIYYLRIAAKGKTSVKRYPAETLRLILHHEALLKRKGGSAEGERSRMKFQRGDVLHFDAGGIGGGGIVGSSVTFDALLLTFPAQKPVVASPDEAAASERGAKWFASEYKFAAARARLDAMTGPVRQVAVMRSSQINVKLLRVTSNVSLQVDAGRAILFAVQGGATVMSENKHDFLTKNSVFLAQTGEKFRLLPVAGKTLYVMMITVGG
jgi:hypothetical protein